MGQAAPGADTGLTVDGLLRARYYGKLSALEWRRLRRIPVQLGLAGRIVAELTLDEAAALALAYRLASVPLPKTVYVAPPIRSRTAAAPASPRPVRPADRARSPWPRSRRR